MRLPLSSPSGQGARKQSSSHVSGRSLCWLLCIGFLLNSSASVQQCVERLGVIEKQTVVDHVPIVGRQFGQRAVIRYKLESTGDGSVIVDDLATGVLFCKERALVIGNCAGEGFVRNGSIGVAGGIQSRHVVPVPHETVTAPELALRAENVNRRDLFPKGAFGAHDLRRRGWERDALQMCGGVAMDGAWFAGLAGRTGAELQHDGGRDIAGAGGQR